MKPSRLPRVAAMVAAVVVLGAASWQVWRMRSVFAGKASHVPLRADGRRQTPPPKPDIEVAPVLMAAPLPVVDTATPPAADTTVSTPTAVAQVPEPPPNAAEPQRAPSGQQAIYARAITWANVRAERDLASVVIGVILPDSIVEIIESRGGWRRVSSAGIAGWADHRFFAVDSTRRRKG